jgi:hypothetical protein
MTAETFIMVENTQMPAAMQPPQSALQSAFRLSAKRDRIVIDMDAAREVARNLVRATRNPLLAHNDGQFAKAAMLEDAALIEATKARAASLRAAPQDPRLAAAQTPDALLDAVDAIIAEMQPK